MQCCDVALHENRLTPGSSIESHNRDKRQIVSSTFQFPTNTSAGLCGNGGDPESGGGGESGGTMMIRLGSGRRDFHAVTPMGIDFVNPEGCTP